MLWLHPLGYHVMLVVMVHRHHFCVGLLVTSLLWFLTWHLNCCHLHSNVLTMDFLHSLLPCFWFCLRSTCQYIINGQCKSKAPCWSYLLASETGFYKGRAQELVEFFLNFYLTTATSKLVFTEGKSRWCCNYRYKERDQTRNLQDSSLVQDLCLE